MRLPIPLLVATLALGSYGSSGGFDSDGNAASDGNEDGLASVVVEGDFNGDGIVNMQDIEDAARSLNPDALEAKSIRVTGSYVYGVADMPDNTATLGRTALLELDSDTTIECDSDVVLQAWDDETAIGGPVIANRDRVQGNRDIHIRRLLDRELDAPQHHPRLLLHATRRRKRVQRESLRELWIHPPG